MVRYRDADGKKRLESFTDKAAADAFVLRRLADKQLGFTASKVTFRNLADIFFRRCEARIVVKDGLRWSTFEKNRSNYKNHFQVLAGRSASGLNLRELQRWLESLALEKRLGQSVLRNCASLAKLILDHAELGGFGRSPFREGTLKIPGRAPGKVDIPSKAEIRRILCAAAEMVKRRGHPVPTWIMPMIYTAVFTGLRQGELRALQWNDVDFRRGLIGVRRAADQRGRIEDPKTSAGFREVPIADALRGVLQAWRLAAPHRQFVFASDHPRSRAPIQHEAIERGWRGLQRRAFGRTAFRFHSLRHVAASLFIDVGMPPKQVQRIMGHASIRMTFDRYGHLFEDPSDLQKAMGRIGL